MVVSNNISMATTNVAVTNNIIMAVSNNICIEQWSAPTKSLLVAVAVINQMETAHVPFKGMFVFLLTYRVIQIDCHL